jgi:protein-S-isoprenylcysteine O-methyltransferase Ste14
LLFVVVQFILLGALVLVAVLLPTESGTGIKLVGVGLVLVGLVLAATALMVQFRVNQGLNASPEPHPERDLITSGPYGRIRHPIYSGVILASLGLAVFHGSGWGYLLAAALLIWFTLKSRFEENLLRQHYADYETYMQRTGRFLPRIG